MAVCHNVIDGTARGCCKTPGHNLDRIISNTMQEPQRGSQLGGKQRLMLVPRRGTLVGHIAMHKL